LFKIESKILIFFEELLEVLYYTFCIMNQRE